MMVDVIFLSDTSIIESLMAAACLEEMGRGQVQVTLAADGNPADDYKLRKVLSDAELVFSGKILPREDDDFYSYDLIIEFCGNKSGHSQLPGQPPILAWKGGGQPASAGDYRKLLSTVRSRVQQLLEDGYLMALVQARRNSELVLDNLSEGIIVHDLQRRIFFFNRAAERITGYQRHEVLGRDCHQVFPGNFCGGKCSFCVEDCKPQLPDKPYSLLFRTSDGGDRQLEMSVTEVADLEGDVKGVVASFRDVSREQELAERLGKIEQFAGIIGRDPKMQEMYQAIRELADSGVPVLVTGESGTGKELVAAAIHNEGSRGGKLFVPVNCGALPENLLESELFGHVRGAFTGALRDKKGRFELADGGTIFLDEIGDISPAMQVKLLRVLQNGTFQRVGDEKTIKVDVRVISATHRNLKEEIAAGRFREDLFYRLCVVPVELPPLRERRGDIPLLARHFIRLVASEERRAELTFAPETMDIIFTYDWPGNVRELQNVIRYLMVRCREDVVRPYHLPDNLLTVTAKQSLSAFSPGLRRKKLTVNKVRWALAKTGGNRVKAAKLLGVGRATLYRFFSVQSDKF